MAHIKERVNKKGETTYSVKIRKKEVDIQKTFYSLEDAKLYEFWKERLIQNMENFEVDLKDRVTISQLYDMKSKTIKSCDKRYASDFEFSKKRLVDFFGETRFIQSITYEEWVGFTRHLLDTDVYKGAKTENGKRKMSPESARKVLAYTSASISHAISKGIELDNLPLKVIQVYLRPFLKK